MDGRERTPFTTAQLWDAFHEAARTNGPSPETILTMARIINAVLPEIIYNPAQMWLVLESAIIPSLKERYPELFSAEAAAEAVNKLGRTVVLEADRTVTGTGWYRNDLDL